MHAESAAPSWAGPRQGVEQGKGRVVVIESGRTYNIIILPGGGGEFGRTPPLLFFSCMLVVVHVTVNFMCALVVVVATSVRVHEDLSAQYFCGENHN